MQAFKNILDESAIQMQIKIDKQPARIQSLRPFSTCSILPSDPGMPKDSIRGDSIKYHDPTDFPLKTKSRLIAAPAKA